MELTKILIKFPHYFGGGYSPAIITPNTNEVYAHDTDPDTWGFITSRDLLCKKEQSVFNGQEYPVFAFNKAIEDIEEHEVRELTSENNVPANVVDLMTQFLEDLNGSDIPLWG